MGMASEKVTFKKGDESIMARKKKRGGKKREKKERE